MFMKDGSFPWNPMESEGRRISKKKVASASKWVFEADVGHDCLDLSFPLLRQVTAPWRTPDLGGAVPALRGHNHCLCSPRPDRGCG